MTVPHCARNLASALCRSNRTASRRMRIGQSGWHADLMVTAAAPRSTGGRDERRHQVREAILHGARVTLATMGLAARVEDIARAAGVSRRTVFRYFETREALLAAAIEVSMRSYGEHVPRPAPGTELVDWLREALVAVHRMNAQHGRVYFELAAGGEVEGELGAIAATRRSARAELVARFARTAWRLGGGRSRTPEWLHDTVAVALSTFATEALGPDFGRTPEQIGRRLAQALGFAIHAAVRSERGAT
jgi:AcrR family transcriptional regulator